MRPGPCDPGLATPTDQVGLTSAVADSEWDCGATRLSSRSFGGRTDKEPLESWTCVRSASEALKAEICLYLTRGFSGDRCLMRLYEPDCLDVVDEALDDEVGSTSHAQQVGAFDPVAAIGAENLSRGATRAGPMLLEPRDEALTHALLTDLRRQSTSVKPSACPRRGKIIYVGFFACRNCGCRISKIVVSRGAAPIPAPSACRAGTWDRARRHQLEPVAAHDQSASTGLTG